LPRLVYQSATELSNFFSYIDYYDRNKKNKNKPEYSVPNVPLTNNIIISTI